ncbi:sulfotransferase family 2 domain-containing protein [Sagittula stellata]|uniref:sulfotransferase family 2 domain-containing protein n=1 Tax=Sagittula stellata TaxID=52603 RepID=UPI0032196E69
MILSHKHKFIFICNGKTGTTSIEKQLMQYQEGAEYEVTRSGLYVGRHIPAFEMKNQLSPEVWNSYYKFGFVRNPYDWFVSVYFWNMLPGPWTKSWKYFVKSPAKWVQARMKERKHAPSGENGKLSVRDVDACREAIRRFRAWEGARDMLQYYHLYDLNGTQLMDKIGKFENLEQDFDEICQVIGIPTPALEKNNATKHKSHTAYYTDETKAHVKEVWKKDFEGFGYDSDPDWT